MPLRDASAASCTRDRSLFDTMAGLALLGDFLFVSDSARHRVVALERDTLSPALAIGDKGAQLGNFNTPNGIGASLHELYVADTFNHRVQVFDADGRWQRAFGGHGRGDGFMQGPMGVCYGHGRVYVAEMWGKRIQVLTPRGTPLQKLVPDSPFDGMFGQISCDARRVYAVDLTERGVPPWRTYQRSTSSSRTPPTPIPPPTRRTLRSRRPPTPPTPLRRQSCCGAGRRGIAAP